jgi:hypothetical protein
LPGRGRNCNSLSKVVKQVAERGDAVLRGKGNGYLGRRSIRGLGLEKLGQELGQEGFRLGREVVEAIEPLGQVEFVGLEVAAERGEDELEGAVEVTEQLVGAIAEVGQGDGGREWIRIWSLGGGELGLKGGAFGFEGGDLGFEGRGGIDGSEGEEIPQALEHLALLGVAFEALAQARLGQEAVEFGQ